MTEFILCMVALSFLAWVVILKSEIGLLKADNQKMRDSLDRIAKKAMGGVDVETPKKPWGKPMTEKDWPKNDR